MIEQLFFNSGVAQTVTVDDPAGRNRLYSVNLATTDTGAVVLIGHNSLTLALLSLDHPSLVLNHPLELTTDLTVQRISGTGDCYVTIDLDYP